MVFCGTGDNYGGTGHNNDTGDNNNNTDNNISDSGNNNSVTDDSNSDTDYDSRCAGDGSGISHSHCCNGQSTRDKHLMGPYAKEARDSGVKILTVGITDKINMTELKKIASQPQSRTILRVGDYTKLITALDNLVGEACVRGTAFVGTFGHAYVHAQA